MCFLFLCLVAFGNLIWVKYCILFVLICMFLNTSSNPITVFIFLPSDLNLEID